MTTEEEHVESKPARRGGRSRESSADVAARRHQGRMLALQVLYEVDLTDHDPEEAMARAFAEHEPVTPDVVEHVRSLVRGVGQHRESISTRSSPQRRQRAISPSKPPSNATSCGWRRTSCCMCQVCRRKSSSMRVSSWPSASVARTRDDSSTACCARFWRSTPATRQRTVRRTNASSASGLQDLVEADSLRPRGRGREGRVYHRRGQVRTAEGASDRGFCWSRLYGVTCRKEPGEGSPLNQRVRAVRRMVGRIEGGNDV